MRLGWIRWIVLVTRCTCVLSTLWRVGEPRACGSYSERIKLPDQICCRRRCGSAVPGFVRCRSRGCANRPRVSSSSPCRMEPFVGRHDLFSICRRILKKEKKAEWNWSGRYWRRWFCRQLFVPMGQQLQKINVMISVRLSVTLHLPNRFN